MAGLTPSTQDRPPSRPAPPLEWPSVISVDGHKGCVTVALEHGRPVHLEIRMAKAGDACPECGHVEGAG